MASQTQVTEKEVRRIAALARLGLTDAEITKATSDLSGILSHFSVIQNIDTQNVPMAADASGLKNVARIDKAEPDVLAAPSELIELAPEHLDGEIKVKAIFE